MKEDFERNKQLFIEDMNKKYASRSYLEKLLFGSKFKMSYLEEHIFEAGYYFGKYEANQELEKIIKKYKRSVKK